MTQSLFSIIYPVSDLAQAKTMFGTVLGVEPSMDAAYYVGYTVGDLNVGLDPQGHGKGMTGPVAYWTVEDIETRLLELVDAGATVHQAPSDAGGGSLIASVKDTDGNIVGLIQSAG